MGGGWVGRRKGRQMGAGRRQAGGGGEGAVSGWEGEGRRQLCVKVLKLT